MVEITIMSRRMRGCSFACVLPGLIHMGMESPPRGSTITAPLLTIAMLLIEGHVVWLVSNSITSELVIHVQWSSFPKRVSNSFDVG